MDKTIDKIGAALAAQMRAVNVHLEEWASDPNRFEKRRKLSKADHELNGMLDMLKIMGIGFEIMYNANATQMIAIAIAGKRFKV